MIDLPDELQKHVQQSADPVAAVEEVLPSMCSVEARKALLAAAFCWNNLWMLKGICPAPKRRAFLQAIAKHAQRDDPWHLIDVQWLTASAVTPKWVEELAVLAFDAIDTLDETDRRIAESSWQAFLLFENHLTYEQRLRIAAQLPVSPAIEDAIESLLRCGEWGVDVVGRVSSLGLEPAAAHAILRLAATAGAQDEIPSSESWRIEVGLLASSDAFAFCKLLASSAMTAAPRSGWPFGTVTGEHFVGGALVLLGVWASDETSELRSTDVVPLIEGAFRWGAQWTVSPRSGPTSLAALRALRIIRDDKALALVQQLNDEFGARRSIGPELTKALHDLGGS